MRKARSKSVSDLIFRDTQLSGRGAHVGRIVNRRQLPVVANQKNSTPRLQWNHKFAGLCSCSFVHDHPIELGLSHPQDASAPSQLAFRKRAASFAPKTDQVVGLTRVQNRQPLLTESE